MCVVILELKELKEFEKQFRYQSVLTKLRVDWMSEKWDMNLDMVKSDWGEMYLREQSKKLVLPSSKEFKFIRYFNPQTNRWS